MLTIGDLNISHVSEPVNIKYLVPKEDIFIEKASLPIIILLGDNHDSDKGRCEPCDEEKGCYLVESDSFLANLNNIAEKIPMDLFTEYAKEHRTGNKGVLFHKFMGKNLGCFDKPLRATKQYTCSFPNIRWHYSDPKLWKGSIENDIGKVASLLARIDYHDKGNFTHNAL